MAGGAGIAARGAGECDSPLHAAVQWRMAHAACSFDDTSKAGDDQPRYLSPPSFRRGETSDRPRWWRWTALPAAPRWRRWTALTAAPPVRAIRESPQHGWIRSKGSAADRGR